MPSRTLIAVALVVLCLSLPGLAEAGPIAVRYAEGVTRAFPVLTSLGGDRLAHGDLTQVVRGDRVESRLVFRFKDGSIYDESVAFSQRDRFELQAYRIVQRGPSFPESLEATVDRDTGRYDVRYRGDEDSPEERLTGKFDMPTDAYNGMLSIVVKNLPARVGETVSIVAFTPKPRAVKLQIIPTTEDPIIVSDAPMTATRYILRPQLGLFASLLIADIPDVRMWILPGEAPAFLRAEGPLYFMGPIWRIVPY
jgi:hypothetical protein